MKSILLKIDDKLFEEMDKHAKRMKISRNGYIREAIADYVRSIKKKHLESELARESMLVRQESLRINKEFDSTLGDGISNEY